MTRFTQFVADLGLRPARLLALMAAWSQLGGGLLLIVGALTGPASLAIAVTMAVAIRHHWKDGFWRVDANWQYPGVLLVVLVFLALAGPGRYSIDALLGSTAN